MSHFVTDINGELMRRYQADDTVSMRLRGVHPEYWIEDQGSRWGIYEYTTDSPNLVGSHPLVGIHFLGGYDGDTAYEPAITIVRGIGYFRRQHFGIEVPAQEIVRIGSLVGVQVKLT